MVDGAERLVTRQLQGLFNRHRSPQTVQRGRMPRPLAVFPPRHCPPAVAALIFAALLAAGSPLVAQTAAAPRVIAYLGLGPSESMRRCMKQLRTGLEQAGWSFEQQLQLEWNDAGGDPARIEPLAQALVTRRIGMISNGSNAAHEKFKDLEPCARQVFVRTNDSAAKPAGSASVQVIDARSGRTGGTPCADDSMYGTAYLAPDGWTWCDRGVPIESTLGNPSRSVYCSTEVALGYLRVTSVAAEAMTALVDRWRGMSSNTINAGASAASLKAALGAATFPDGAEEQRRGNVVVNTPIFIDNLSARGQPQSRNALEALIAFYPTAGAAAPA